MSLLSAKYSPISHNQTLVANDFPQIFTLPVVIQDLMHCSGAPRARDFPRGQHIKHKHTALLISGNNRAACSIPSVCLLPSNKGARLSPKS
jgi:hypothetical protein